MVASSIPGRRGYIVQGWVTAFGRANYISISLSYQANSVSYTLSWTGSEYQQNVAML